MKIYPSRALVVAVGISIAVVAVEAGAHRPRPMPVSFAWRTVVNNTDPMPGAPLQRNFNSYNQPSVNVYGMVVIRARSIGGGGQPATHGIYTRDMSIADGPIVRILDRSSLVPQPNNLDTLFVETPSFPRIDMWSNTIATRGNHQPTWRYLLDDDSETRAGTTGIYTNAFGGLMTAAAKLGAVPGFEFFAVPGLDPPSPFDVFPGAPSVTDGGTVVFKGNFTVDDVGKTGVFYRDLVDEPINGGPGGGTNPVMLIANNTDTLIPGTDQVFGSTSPPSAANRIAVFSGFDDEDHPTVGGIYFAPLGVYHPLTGQHYLKTLVSIGERVPGEPAESVFNGLGEGGAFDGRHVGFWGSWGTETRTARLYCPTEGNKDRIDYCNRSLVCSDTGEALGDPDSICDDPSDPYFGIRCYQERRVPVHQGIFVHDIAWGGLTRTVAKTGNQFGDFLFWNYSGKVPCVGRGHGVEGAEDDGEPARWRSSAFVAVSGRYTALKAASATGDIVGIYLSRGPLRGIVTVLDTRTDGQVVDPEAPAGSTVTEVGLEREGLRGNWLAVNAKMGIEGGSAEEGMAGVYITNLRPNTEGACINGLDDDGDGLVDMADPGCQSNSDPDETRADIACDDGVDDDGDGLVDMADPGCPSPYATIENPQCDDGIDNDQNGAIDFADSKCQPDWPYWEMPPACGIGAELALALPLIAAAASRRRRAN